MDVAVDPGGDVFFVDAYGGKFSANGSVLVEVLAAGRYRTSKTLQKDLSGVSSVAVDINGNVFVTDSNKYGPSCGIGMPICGGFNPGNGVIHELLAADGYGTANTIGGTIQVPAGIAAAENGDVFISDPEARKVYRIHHEGGDVTVEPIGEGFAFPTAVTVDSQGNVFVADLVQTESDGDVFLPTWVKEISVAGGYARVDTLGRKFNGISSLAVDSHGNVFVCGGDIDQRQMAVDEILAEGGYMTVKPVANGFGNPDGIAVDERDNVFVVDWDSYAIKEASPSDGYVKVATLKTGIEAYMDTQVDRVRSSQVRTGFGRHHIGTPFAVDKDDNLFVYDFDAKAVKEIVAAGGYATVKILGSGGD